MPHPPDRGMVPTTAALPLLLLMLTLIAGCPSSDRETKQILRESLDRQAEQNQAMARQSQEVAAASKRLVAADAEARREIVGVHRDIQEERAGLDEQQDLLEADRKTLAVQKQREPLIANMLLTVALILAALLPLLVAYWLLVRTQETSADDGELANVLIGELTAETPLLLTPLPSPSGSSHRLAADEGPRRLSDAGTPADNLD